MAQIVINEISANYTYNIGTSSYATVALPITSCWGPGYFDPEAEYGSLTGDNVSKMLEKTVWQRFPATQEGLESFVSTYRGPADCYRLAKDNSYQMAVTLLTSGYDVLTCRMCPGAHAEGTMVQYNNSTTSGSDYAINGSVKFRAKYPGTFGNHLQLVVTLQRYLNANTRKYHYYWNIVTYVVDSSGVRSSVENKSLTFDINNASDSVPYYEEVVSNFWEIKSVSGTIVEELVTVDSAQVAPKNLVWRDPAFVTTPPSGRKASEYYQNYVKFGVAQDDAAATEDIKATFPTELGTDYASAKIPNAEQTTLKTTYETKKTAYEEAKAAWEQAGSPTDSDAPTKEAMDAAEVEMNTAKDAYGASIAKTFADVMGPRFKWAKQYALDTSDDYAYPVTYTQDSEGTPIAPTGLGTYIVNMSTTMQNIYLYQEWVRTHAVGLGIIGDDGYEIGGVYDLLKDKLSYNPNRVVSPGWDDQDYTMYVDDQDDINTLYGQTTNSCEFPVSPLHYKLMDVAYYSRCATGFIDVPKSIERKYVHIEDPNDLNRQGYVQKLARVVPKNAMLDNNGSLFTTNCGLFAPWGQFTYVGTSKLSEASPSFLTLLIQRAQILNQAVQYEWALPTNRKHNLKIGKMEYTVPKKVLDQWQKLDGASVNVITNIPDLGTNIWGNSTLFEVPPATYQALANLSTRFLVNAVEDVVYRCGIAITFQYNNNQAYNKFFAGVTPILDTMKNVGAIDDYKVKMSADINGEDHVNANTVIGKIWLVVNGVINDIIVDLVALPPTTDLNQFA